MRSNSLKNSDHGLFWLPRAINQGRRATRTCRTWGVLVKQNTFLSVIVEEGEVAVIVIECVPSWYEFYGPNGSFAGLFEQYGFNVSGKMDIGKEWEDAGVYIFKREGKRRLRNPEESTTFVFDAMTEGQPFAGATIVFSENRKCIMSYNKIKKNEALHLHSSCLPGSHRLFEWHKKNAGRSWTDKYVKNFPSYLFAVIGLLKNCRERKNTINLIKKGYKF